MSLFFRKIVLFLVPIILVFTVIEISLRYIPNEYTKKIEGFETSIEDIEILFLGSSHTLRAINPSEFQNFNVFNMAMVSQPLQIDYKIFEKYRDKLQNLKIVFVTISYFTLSKNLEEGEIVKRIPFYKNYYNLEDLPFTFSLVTSIGVKKSIITFMNYYIFKLKKDIRTDEYGYMGEGGFLANDSVSFSKSALEASGRHEDYSLDFNKNLTLIQNIIAYSAKRGIKVVLIKTPKTEEYLLELDSIKLNLINSRLIKLEETYSNVIYFNFNNLYKDKAYFRNSDHLNEKGATEFSSYLNKQINEILKKQD